MSEEKRKLGDYEIIQSIYIGDKEVVFGVNKKDPYPFMVCCCDYHNPLSAAWPTEGIASDDYLEAMQIFVDRVQSQIDRTKAELAKFSFDKTVFTKEHCIHDDGMRNIVGKVVVINSEPKCRMNPDEPTPDPEIPDAPPHLSPEAREEWERLALELYELGILSTIDRAALAAYCQAYGRWVEAEEQLRNIDGTMKLTETTSNGNIIQNPLVGIANKSLELMHKYLTEFGMSPSSRTRVSAKKKTGEKKGFAAL